MKRFHITYRAREDLAPQTLELLADSFAGAEARILGAVIIDGKLKHDVEIVTINLVSQM